MNFKQYLKIINQCEKDSALKKIRNRILYDDNEKLDKSDMFLLAELIEFKRRYL